MALVGGIHGDMHEKIHESMCIMQEANKHGVHMETGDWQHWEHSWAFMRSNLDLI